MVLIRFIKFGLVGCTGVGVDFAVTFLLKEKFQFNKYISNAIGFLLASSSNFLLNRYWTFASHDPHVGIQYFKFMIISIIGLALSTTFVFLGHDRLKLNFYLAKLCSIFIVVIWNFSANSWFTFQ